MSRNKILHLLFEKQVKRSPGYVAVQQGERTINYLELSKRSDYLAYYLSLNFIKRNDVVVTYLDKSIDLIVSILGISKSGAAYCPIDINYPSSRIKQILDDTDTKVIITSKKYFSLFENNDSEIIYIENIFEANNIKNKTVNISHNDDLAYILYTSGTSGSPKGVMIEHINIVNFLEWAQVEYKLDHNDVVASFTPIIFDVSLLEFFLPLLNGAKLLLASKPSDIYLSDFLLNTTFFCSVPSAFRSLIAFQDLLSGNYDMPKLRIVNFAGESLDNKLVNKVYEYLNPDKIYNCYGPTETTIYTSFYLIPRNTDTKIPIGKVISPSEIYILNEYLETAEEGEIYIGGNCVGRGYLNLRNETELSFIQNPLNKIEKIYKTGDIGRINHEGNIFFIGRKDSQVKINGHRVELSEIEMVLNKHHNIKISCVQVKKGPFNENTIIAYVMDNSKITLEEIKTYLTKSLPKFMIPSEIVLLDEFPLTPSGKIDVNKLLI